MILRVSKEYAAFLYQLLESYEGLASYSTLTEGKTLPYRDIELFPGPGQEEELERVLVALQAEIPIERLR